MTLKFRSKAGADLLMLDAHAKQLLRLLGREAGPPGILQPAQMPQALAALEAAIGDDERARRGDGDGPTPGGDRGERPAGGDGVSLKRRLWPMMQLIRAAQAADEPIVWGV